MGSLTLDPADEAMGAAQLKNPRCFVAHAALPARFFDRSERSGIFTVAPLSISSVTKQIDF